MHHIRCEGQSTLPACCTVVLYSVVHMYGYWIT